MIGPTGAVRVMAAIRPVDFRKGAEGFAALVREELRAEVITGIVNGHPNSHIDDLLPWAFIQTTELKALA